MFAIAHSARGEVLLELLPDGNEWRWYRAVEGRPGARGLPLSHTGATVQEAKCNLREQYEAAGLSVSFTGEGGPQ
jgi:hypothetical protein